jgi:hypothetical protein
MALAALGLLGQSASAWAAGWFPHPPGGRWSYRWSNPTYNPNGTTESVTVAGQSGAGGCGWQLAWTGTIEIPLGTSGGTSSGPGPVFQSPDNGTMCFQDQNYGLLNTDWASTPPPVNMPPLCPTSTPSNQCANSLGSALYDVIWGTRSPVIAEPLLQGTTWNATGGGDGSVNSINTYLGVQRISVPAFTAPVAAAVIRSQVGLTGVPGSSFGSGTRTTWWVYGVGPVKLEFDHNDRSVTTAALQSTNLTPHPPPPDRNYFPLSKGLSGTYEWRNSRHFREPEVQRVSISSAGYRAAQFSASSISGPIRARGEYAFSLRVDGLSNTYNWMSGASVAKLPKLGHQLHFFTPLDLMIYGFNPVLPAYPVPGTVWRSGNRRDAAIFGVTGWTKVIGVRRVRVRAGVFQALEIESSLSQRGYRFGSGLRTMWFAPGRGLVKLQFNHADHSVSVIQLVK